MDFNTADDVYSFNIVHTPAPGSENDYSVSLMCGDEVVSHYTHVIYYRINGIIESICKVRGMTPDLHTNPDYDNINKIRRIIK